MVIMRSLRLVFHLTTSPGAVNMGCCLSRDIEKERVISLVGRIAENVGQLVIIHRQLTSATNDLRRAYSDGVNSVREMNNSEDIRLRALNVELAKIRTELREINNTCRVSAGGLPTVPYGSRECVYSDCDSIHSERSNTSVISGARKHHGAAAVARSRKPQLSPPIRSVYENDKTLTRNATPYDSDGYVLPM